MPDMQFGEFVIGQIQHRKTCLAQAFHQGITRVVFRVSLHADENMRLVAVVITVVELGNLALTERFAERLETPRTLGNGHRDNRLAFFTKLGALRDMAQAVEIDIRPRGHRRQYLPAHAAAFDILLDSRQRQRTRRFGNLPGILI